MIQFKVEGMTCGSCVKHVTKAIQAEDPQAQVQVDLAQGLVRVTSQADAKKLAARIEEEGYSVAETRSTG